MKVEVLQQYLCSLLGPLKDAQAADNSIDDLNSLIKSLSVFAKKPAREFAEFISRCQTYEREGHWPVLRPNITGNAIDIPSPELIGIRIQHFLEREVQANRPLKSCVEDELANLKQGLSLKELKQMASSCGVNLPV